MRLSDSFEGVLSVSMPPKTPNIGHIQKVSSQSRELSHLGVYKALDL